ncbi:MAG TPA: hypothetical protein VF735_14305 [Pyrinomonadaceae bacterium]
MDRSYISVARPATHAVASRHYSARAVTALKPAPTGIDYAPLSGVGPLSTITPTTTTHAREPVLLAQRDRLARLAPRLADNARLSLHNIYTTTSTKRDVYASRATTAPAPCERAALVVEAVTLAGSQTFLRSPLWGKFFSTWQKN